MVIANAQNAQIFTYQPYSQLAKDTELMIKALFLQTF